MANPPFAGDIKEPRMIARYDLAKKSDGKWQSKVGRDILFIERNLDFLKPGGRMAIVLPQGRFNNSSDKYIRDYLAERCRILAVVGLHKNSFQPHTGTKTSVLFVQKWNDDPKAGVLCPRKDDYNIFFATMRKSGKDNSGEKIWRRVYVSSSYSSEDEENVLNPPSPVERRVGMEGDFLQDSHGHLVVDHDLYNHEGLTEDGIAEAFIEFAKKEKLSFFKSSPSVTPFDAEKYERLIDGLEAAEVQFSEMTGSERLDAEFAAHPATNWLKTLQQKRQFFPLGEFVDYISSGHTPYKHNVDQGEIGFITVECIDFLQFALDKLKRIDKKHYDTEFKKNRIVKNSIACTIKRRICKSYPFLDEPSQPLAMNQDVAFIIPKTTISSGYLAAYLSSKVGQSFADKQKTEQMNPYISVGNLSKLPVTKLFDDFQLKIERCIRKANSILEDSKSLYHKAVDLLLSELNLKDWQPTDETIAVKSFAESYLVSDRLDAEYYEPKQQKVMAIMRQSGFHIGDIAKLAKRKFHPEKQGTFNYIEIGNLSGEGFANSEVVAMEEAPSRAQWIVKTNDVITSTVRPIRRLSAVIEPEQNNYICSSGFAVLKPVKVESEVLLVYLRLPVVCEILNLHTTASMYPAISIDDLLNIPITLPDESIRQKIAEKVRASRKAREQSKQLLEIAKTGVERAIETDEATAIAWMNQQLEALGVELSR
jgi:type I restriction enzyme M protein